MARACGVRATTSSIKLNITNRVPVECTAKIATARLVCCVEQIVLPSKVNCISFPFFSKGEEEGKWFRISASFRLQR